MNILITGDSHTHAIRKCLSVLTKQGKTISEHNITVRPISSHKILLTPFFTDQGDHLTINHQEPENGIKKFPVSDPFIHWYGLTAPFHSNHFWNNRQWKNYSPLLKNKYKFPVSRSLLHQLVWQDIQYIFKFIEATQRMGLNLFVIESPKPFRHHPANVWIDSEFIFYLDTFYRKTVQSWLADHGVPVITVPETCYDSEGFMFERYRHHEGNDATHANHWFGLLMLEKIIKFANEKETLSRFRSRDA